MSGFSFLEVGIAEFIKSEYELYNCIFVINWYICLLVSRLALNTEFQKVDMNWFIVKFYCEFCGIDNDETDANNPCFLKFIFYFLLILCDLVWNSS